MKNSITLYGKIVFDPKDRTKKHGSQSSWKKTVMIELDGDVCEYYAWFLNKRYNLKLNKPLRGPHVTIINESNKDLGQFGLDNWEEVKKKWNGKKIKVVLDVDACTDERGEHWWFRVSREDREEIHSIRAELGLDRPYWGLHMTIGTPNNKYIEHSKYIHRLISKGIIKY